MYLCHQYRKSFEIASLLVDQGWLEEDDVDDSDEIGKAIERFKKKVNDTPTSIRYGAPIDKSISTELADDLKYWKIQERKFQRVYVFKRKLNDISNPAMEAEYLPLFLFD